MANGLNPKYSDIDPYAMAASAIDEALRNIVAVGGDPAQTAILDNFCWGNCDKPDRLGLLQYVLLIAALSAMTKIDVGLAGAGL